MNLGMIYAGILPYHAARYRALMVLAEKRQDNVILMAMRATSWQLPDYEAQELIDDTFVIVVPDPSGDIEQWNSLRALWHLLNAQRPSVMLVPGYAMRFCWIIIVWCKLNRVPMVMMSDSRATAFQGRRYWLEQLKKQLLPRLFQTAFVAGKQHVGYALEMGFAPQHIFTGYDAVDNDYWMDGVEQVRQSPEMWQEKLNLPHVPYFLLVNRLIPEKNLDCFLKGYAKYVQQSEEAWSLVIVGSGPLTVKIEQQIQLSGLDDIVLMHGYQPAEHLIGYYGLASCFVFSTQSDTWGLAINEAMAASLPLLISQAAGAVDDLVVEGENGWSFDPFSVADTAAKLTRMSNCSADVRAQMGAVSQQLIQQFSSERFAQNAFAAAEVALGIDHSTGE